MHAVFNFTTEKFERREGVPTLAQMQAHVGGNYTKVTLAEVPGTSRAVDLILADDMPEDCRPSLCTLDHQRLYGPCMAVMADDRTGEYVPMTEDELARLECGRQHLIDFRAGKMVPIVSWA